MATRKFLLSIQKRCQLLTRITIRKDSINFMKEIEEYSNFFKIEETLFLSEICSIFLWKTLFFTCPQLPSLKSILEVLQSGHANQGKFSPSF